MSPRTIRRSIERKQKKLAAKALAQTKTASVTAEAKSMTATVGSGSTYDSMTMLDNNPKGNNVIFNTDIEYPKSNPVADSQTEEPHEKTISPAKLLANQQNAQHSTGAKTEAGRAASKMNAVRHGLCGKLALLPDEDAAAYKHLVDSHFERYSPAAGEEEELVQMIADNAWRILQIPRREASIFSVGRSDLVDTMYTKETDPVRHGCLIEGATLMLYEKHLRNLYLQERRIRKQHQSDIDKLKAIQAERLARPKRAADEVIQANAKKVMRLQDIAQRAADLKITFNPADFGFVLSFSEWQLFQKRQDVHFLLSEEYLNLDNFLEDLRAAPDDLKIA